MTPRRSRTPAGRSRGPQANTQDKRSGTGQGTERPGAALLIAALDAASCEPKETSRGHWVSRCPMPDHHGDGKPDAKPSFYIDVRLDDFRLRWCVFARCTGCGANGGAVCKHLGLSVGRVLFEGNDAYAHQKPKYVEELSEKRVGEYVTYLGLRPALLSYLTDERGLVADTISRYEVGYDEGLDKYVLPVREGGRLMNLRRYKRGAPPGDKMRNASGHGSPPRLYPSLPPSGAIVVCEGEWDALVLNQHGILAVTSTGGAGSFLEEWVRLFRRRHVAFVYDCDDAGRQHAPAHAAKVATVARSVRVVDLDPSRDDKWDVNDWFNEGRSAEDLRALINGSPPSPLGTRK